jgi:hypothetical protein
MNRALPASGHRFEVITLYRAFLRAIRTKPAVGLGGRVSLSSWL